MSLREFANRGCKIDATGSQESGYRLAEGGLNHGIGKPLEINVLGYRIAEGRSSNYRIGGTVEFETEANTFRGEGFIWGDDPTAPPLYDPAKPGPTIRSIRRRH